MAALFYDGKSQLSAEEWERGGKVPHNTTSVAKWIDSELLQTRPHSLDWSRTGWKMSGRILSLDSVLILFFKF